MKLNKWIVDDAGTLMNTEPKAEYYDDLPFDIVNVLNDYETKVCLLEELTDSQANTIASLREHMDKMALNISKLQDDNNKLQSRECECDTNYWRGIESAYEKLVHKLYERNVDLERQNQVLVDRLCMFEELEHEEE